MSQQPSYAAVSDDAPYPGLRPYHESEKDKFFGRDADCKILIDKILVNRLTLLFAATGVGKSSLLQAAVLPQLKEPHGENLDVVYYIDWVSNPLTGLRQAVQQALQDSGSWRPEIVYAPREDEKLADFFSFCTLFVRQPLVVVLDQFEEFFRYQRGHDSFEPFLEQLTGVFSDLKLPVHLVFSMREDFALELNAFKKYVPLSVFSNLYRLEKLGRKAAEMAILEPLKPTGFRYEPALLQQLLQDLLSRELSRDANSPLADMTEVVEPPYLQIACLQLWEREQANLEKTLRLKTYQAAGGAKGLLENYIFNTLQDFSEREKVVTSHALNHLIGQRGTKVAHTVPRLAALIRVPESELDQVLFKLGQKRILRSQPREDVLWYELYHDMFSAGLERWNNRQKEKMRNRRLVQIGGAAAAAILVITFGTIWGVNHFNHHLRLVTGNDSAVEVYRGKEGWPDPFYQQIYEYETTLMSREMEPDKRFQQRVISDYADLNNHLTGYLPLEKRIAIYIEDGNFSKALDLEEKSTLSGNNTTFSNNVIRVMFNLRTKNGFALLKILAIENKQNTLKKTAIDFLQENTLFLSSGELASLLKNAIKYTHIPNPTLLSDPRLFTELSNHLNDKDNDIRQAAAETLAQCSNIDFMPQFMKMLQDENPNMRQAAAEALGQIGNPSSTPQIKKVLQDENPKVRQAARLALGRLGDPSAIPHLIQSYQDYEESRWDVMQIFGQIDSSSAVSQLTQLLRDENPIIRQAAAEALGWVGDTEAIDQLTQVLQDKNTGVRKSAAHALGQIGDAIAIPQLMQLFNDENIDVKQSVAHALGQINDTMAIRLLMELLGDNSAEVRSSAAYAIGQIGDTTTIPQLTQLLSDNNAEVRGSAADALGQIGDSSSVLQINQALKDKNQYVRQRAAVALGEIGHPMATEPLAQTLKDEDEHVRLYAADALGKIGDYNATYSLNQALKDESQIVRQATVLALGEIGDPRSIVPLIKTLNENDNIRTFGTLGLIGIPANIQVDKAIKKQQHLFKWADFFNHEKLGLISGTVKDRKALLQALNLPISPERNQSLLAFTKNPNIDWTIRKKSIEVLAEAKDANLIKSLQTLKSQLQLKKAVIDMENAILPPLVILHDTSRRLSARLAAFQRLAKQDPTTAKPEILRITQQPEEDAFSNLAYRLLGDLQITDNGVVPLLQQRLAALDEQFRDWRKLRDSKPLSGLTTEEQDKVLAEIRDAKDAIKNQQFAFDYAYALARLDPDIGKRLLTHNLADVRKGAYMGFAMKANIKTLKALDEEREARRDDPIFRHEAFRAIDIGLHRLEILGNNPRDGEKDKELKELRAWQQQLESAAPRTTPDDPDDEVLERLQWTTLMMEHYNKLDTEFREKYGKMRVWPEDALPVNQPYPNQGS